MRKVAQVSEGARSVKIPVEFEFDVESKGWAFEVPSLNIIGGAASRDEAEDQAREAILYALEGQPLGPAGTDRTYFEATVSSVGCLVA